MLVPHFTSENSFSRELHVMFKFWTSKVGKISCKKAKVTFNIFIDVVIVECHLSAHAILNKKIYLNLSQDKFILLTFSVFEGIV